MESLPESISALVQRATFNKRLLKVSVEYDPAMVQFMAGDVKYETRTVALFRSPDPGVSNRQSILQLSTQCV